MTINKITAQMGWNFNNSFTRLPERLYTRILPVKAPNPALVILNKSLSQDSGLDLLHSTPEQLAQLFSGNILPPGAESIAQAYAGHQFGYFTNLGDGRAHLIGEHITPDGSRLDIQFKGSGQTPYGLRGDGRAALGPMLREYLISEAMYNLGIPTTRSLAVVTTGELIYRETRVPGAVLTRVAASHLRVGTFEYLAAKNDLEELKQLADYTIDRHYPEARDTQNPYLGLLQAVMLKQIDLIVHWMRVGFIHGVMNTDNMALSGQTIDYGPCAFMDEYDPKTVFSAIDTMGRYCFGNQPAIAQWNLACFAGTLIPFLHEKNSKAMQIAEEVIDDFSGLFQNKWQAMMGRKLGLSSKQPEDTALVSDLLNFMENNHLDYTNTFIDLSKEAQPSGAAYKNAIFQDWFARWQLRLKMDNKIIQSAHSLMIKNNPVVIPRNHNVNKALEAATNGDMSLFHSLLNACEKPYSPHFISQTYQSPPLPDERVFQTFCGT